MICIINPNFSFWCIYRWLKLESSEKLSPLFSAQSTSIDLSRSPDQYPLSDMVCNKAVLTKVGAGGRRVSSNTTRASTLNPAMLLCAALPCIVQSISFDQSCQLHSGPATVHCSVHVCVSMMNTLWRTTLSRTHMCVYPNITNLSPSLYHQVLLQCPHTFPCTHTRTKAIKSTKSMDSDKHPHVLL